jgi:hypothetical protein
MSAINTNGLDVNYPIPGQNNSSQGFRNNFASIKTNLDTAGTEISDLQNKVVVKSALDNTIVNNDMANTLISNCATRSFRATTYNLGNALSGTVTVNCSLGDVQYGTVASNVTFDFASWGPAGTQSNVELQLATSNSQAFITFPAAVVSSNNNFGLTTLENYDGTTSVSFPYGVSLVDYRLSSMDCGNTITIEPYNRPRQTTQIQQRTPSPKGYQGDVVGTTCVDSGAIQLSITSSNAADFLNTTNTTELYTDLPIVFTGVSMEANITIGTTYYVRNVSANTYFTVSSTIGGANVDLAGNASPTSAMLANPVQYMYVATQDYNSTQYTRTVTNTNATGNLVTLSSTTSLNANDPIVFTGTTFGGITAGTIYYIKAVSSPNVTLSRTRTNGIAGSTVELTTAAGSCTATVTSGSDIWKRTTLTSW